MKNEAECGCDNCRDERELLASGLLDEAYAGLHDAAVPVCRKIAELRGEDGDVNALNVAALLLAVAARICVDRDIHPDKWMGIAVASWNTAQDRAEAREGTLQ